MHEREGGREGEMITVHNIIILYVSYTVYIFGIYCVCNIWPFQLVLLSHSSLTTLPILVGRLSSAKLSHIKGRPCACHSVAQKYTYPPYYSQFVWSSGSTTF